MNSNQPASQTRSFGKIALGSSIILLTAAVIFSAAVFSQKCHVSKNFTASQRILHTMKQKAVELALENQNLQKELKKYKKQTGVASVYVPVAMTVSAQNN